MSGKPGKRERNYLPTLGRSQDEQRRFDELPPPGRRPDLSVPSVPTYEQLVAQGRVADAAWWHRYYTRREKHTPEHARIHSLDTLSVAPGEQVGGVQPKSPDAVVVGAQVTVEIKRLDTARPETMQNPAYEARTQSRRLFITGLDTGTAFGGLTRILRSQGLDFDEILVEYVGAGHARALH